MILARSKRIFMIKDNDHEPNTILGESLIQRDPLRSYKIHSLILIIEILKDRAGIMIIIHDQRDFPRSFKVHDHKLGILNS